MNGLYLLKDVPIQKYALQTQSKNTEEIEICDNLYLYTLLTLKFRIFRDTR